MLRQHAGVLALTVAFGLYALWAAFKWSAYYPFKKGPPYSDAFEDHIASITPLETPFMKSLKKDYPKND